MTVSRSVGRVKRPREARDFDHRPTFVGLGPPFAAHSAPLLGLFVGLRVGARLAVVGVALFGLGLRAGAAELGLVGLLDLGLDRLVAHSRERSALTGKASRA